MTNIYETTIIVKPDLANDQLKSLNTSIDQFFSDNNISHPCVTGKCWLGDWDHSNTRLGCIKCEKFNFKESNVYEMFR